MSDDDDDDRDERPAPYSTGRMGRCAECGEWAWLPHECPPQWLVWDAEDGEPGDPADACVVRARDAEEAAERFAKESDVEGDVIDHGGIDVVFVASADDPTKMQRLRVSAEARVHYTAYDLEESSE